MAGESLGRACPKAAASLSVLRTRFGERAAFKPLCVTEVGRIKMALVVFLGVALFLTTDTALEALGIS